jgi:hypothetical protein
MLTIIKETAKKTPVRKAKKTKEVAGPVAGATPVSVPVLRSRIEAESAPAVSSGGYKLKLKLPAPPQSGSPADSSHPASPNAMAVDVPNPPGTGPPNTSESAESHKLPPSHSFQQAPSSSDPPKPANTSDDGGKVISPPEEYDRLGPVYSFFQSRAARRAQQEAEGMERPLPE